MLCRQVDRNVAPQPVVIHLLGDAAAFEGPVLEKSARRDELRAEDGIGPGVELAFFARDFAPEHRKTPGVSVIKDLDDLRALVRKPEIPFIDDERPTEGVENTEEGGDRGGAAGKDWLVAE